ncbi:MAG TPA: glycosyltransferase family protein [Chitinophagales bacterium]|nr:glycosyltransferase family protein [Chitinophagales bacterium]HNK97640.1 glycosyltransferase family protein [Chitinophagales bacterium]
MSAPKPLNILIAPLDWGLGHATRSIPIIKACVDRGHTVVIASTGRSLALLRREFPELTCLDVPAYDIAYQEKGSFILKILGQLGKIFSGIRREHRATKEIVRLHQIDLVISDNRYGFYHKKIHSVIITHQMMVKIPSFVIAEPFVYGWLQLQHKRFNTIWIPDVAGEANISGDLSHKYPVLKRTHYIGILTRFSRPLSLPAAEKTILAIISGPEPQRTLFERLIVTQGRLLPHQFILIQGISDEHRDEQLTDNIRVISHLPGKELYDLILRCDVIISRGGYSTLMDLALLNKKCIFVPTPGQTEQEYLVKELGEKGLVVAGDQSTFRLEDALEKVQHTKGFYIPSNEQTFIPFLEAAIAEAVKSKV